MSSALVKKSLRLVTDDCDSAGAKPVVVRRRSRAALRRRRQQSLRKRQEEDEDHQQEAEHTLHLLRMLSGARANAALVEQVAAFNTATTTAQHRHAQKQTHEPKSCFSEKDFEEFEREHFLGELV